MKAGITAIQNTCREIVGEGRHEDDGEQRAEHGADGVERLAQAEAVPRKLAGVRSAISASRGAPRMPLPTRSTKRAAISQAMFGASGNTGLVMAARP